MNADKFLAVCLPLRVSDLLSRKKAYAVVHCRDHLFDARRLGSRESNGVEEQFLLLAENARRREAGLYSRCFLLVLHSFSGHFHSQCRDLSRLVTRPTRGFASA